MDLNRLGQGHRIAAGAGVLLFIDLFLNWYSVSDEFTRGFVNLSFSAWDAFDFTDLLLAVTALVAIAAAVQSLGVLRLPVRLSSVLLPLAGVMTLIVIYRIINQPSDNDAIDVSWGAWLGLVLTAAVAYGAMKAQSEPEAVGPADVNTAAATPAATAPAPAAPAEPAAPPPAPADDEPPPPSSPMTP